jgi:hypothetical protein
MAEYARLLADLYKLPVEWSVSQNDELGFGDLAIIHQFTNSHIHQLLSSPDREQPIV